MPNILEVSHVSKRYSSGPEALLVLDDINFTVPEGEILSIVGPSGSGKTTLLGLSAGLDRVTEGRISIAGKDITQFSEDQRAKVRTEYVGFIFQNFQLIPTLTALENVMVPIELQGGKNAQQIALQMLDWVGLSARSKHYPVQLSGGEQQRVAIARAFANKPRLLFADEPTGNLDFETGEKVEKLIFDLNRESGTTLVIVTHDVELSSKTNRTLHIKGGKLISDQLNPVHA
jgi:putative ABC transport system ATP-binding protein